MRKITPLKAIRSKCLDCSGSQPKEVRLCPITNCALYPYRLGTNPARQGLGGHPKTKTLTETPENAENEVING